MATRVLALCGVSGAAMYAHCVLVLKPEQVRQPQGRDYHLTCHRVVNLN